MEDTFYTVAEDKGLSIILKREANIILASLDKDSDEYKFKRNRFEEVIRVVRAIEDTEPQRDEDVDFILDSINKIWNVGILSPLTLKMMSLMIIILTDAIRTNVILIFIIAVMVKFIMLMLINYMFVLLMILLLILK